MSRRGAREYALKFLFSANFNEVEDLESSINDFFELYHDEEANENRLTSGDKQFFCELIRGVLENLNYIDELIKKHAQGWKIDRIAKVDLNILRLALYEILHRDDIPESVSINEAVELSKKFSTDESGKFVNGILASIVKTKDVEGI